MRISYSLLSTMAQEGDRNAQYCLAKWDMELSSPTLAPEDKVECIVRDSGEMSIVVGKKTLMGMPAVSVETAPTVQQEPVEVKTPEPPAPSNPTLPGNGRRTPMRPTFRKQTWQWLDVPTMLKKSKEAKLPQTGSDKKDLPCPSTYSFVSEASEGENPRLAAEGDDYI